MALQLSVAVRNARLDAVETEVGASPKLRILTGAQPANCAAAQTGTVLVEVTAPSDWLANAATGSKLIAGTWTGVGLAAGTAGHFRLVDSTGTTCHMQGSITVTGGGGDMTFDTTTIAIGQTVNIPTFTLADANA